MINEAWEAAQATPRFDPRRLPRDITRLVGDYIVPRIYPGMTALYVERYRLGVSVCGMVRDRIVAVLSGPQYYLYIGNTRHKVAGLDDVQVVGDHVRATCTHRILVFNADGLVVSSEERTKTTTHQPLARNVYYIEGQAMHPQSDGILIPGACGRAACAYVHALYVRHGPCECPRSTVPAFYGFTRGGVDCFYLGNGFATRSASGWHYLFPIGMISFNIVDYPIRVGHETGTGFRQMFYDHRTFDVVGYWDSGSPSASVFVADGRLFAFEGESRDLYQLFFAPKGTS